MPDLQERSNHIGDPKKRLWWEAIPVIAFIVILWAAIAYVAVHFIIKFW